LFAQLWKEYALSDSRYLVSDAFTVCMEGITSIFWGPVCYVVALCIANSHPLRYPLQGLVCLGVIYGDVLYYGTAMFDLHYRNVAYCRPERYYFWFYFFLMNFFWIVIPGCELSLLLLQTNLLTLSRVVIPKYFNDAERVCCSRPHAAKPGQWTCSETQSKWTREGALKASRSGWNEEALALRHFRFVSLCGIIASSADGDGDGACAARRSANQHRTLDRFQT
jgi:hypothetical protein